MKKTIIAIIFINILLLLSFQIVSFSIGTDSTMLHDNKSIFINNNKEENNTEFLEKISNEVTLEGGIITYVMEEIENNKKVTYVYTNNVNAVNEMNENRFSIFNKYIVRQLVDASNYNLEENNEFFITSDNYQKIFEIINCYYNCSLESENGQYMYTIKMLFFYLQIILVIIFLTSIFFYSASKSKEYKIKRVFGYSFLRYLREEICFFISFFIIFFVLTQSIILFFIYKMKNFETVKNYVGEFIKFDIAFGGIFLILLVIPMTFMFRFKSREYIQGKKEDSIPYWCILFFKCFVMLYLLSAMESTVSHSQNQFNLYKINKELSQMMEKYHVLEYTNYERMRAEGLDDPETMNHKILYDSISEKYEPIIIWCNQAQYAQYAEDMSQYFLIVNENYLKSNPVFTIDGEQIVSGFDSNKLTLLVPETANASEMFSFFKDYPYERELSEDELEIISYKSGTKCYSYNPDYSNYYIDPILMIYNEKYEIPDNIYAYIQNGCILFKSDTTNFVDEIRTEIDNASLSYYIKNSYQLNEVFELKKVEYLQELILSCVIFAVLFTT